MLFPQPPVIPPGQPGAGLGEQGAKYPQGLGFFDPGAGGGIEMDWGNHFTLGESVFRQTPARRPLQPFPQPSGIPTGQSGAGWGEQGAKYPQG